LKTETGTDIHKAADIIRNGGLVAIPTETVYGLAADALNPGAVLRIFHVKKRPDFDPLIVHAASSQQAFQWAENVPEKARLLAEAFWPGPLTLVLHKKEEIPYEVTSGLNTVGLRVPDHPLTLALLRALDCPLAAPSANPFGYISPTEAAHVNQHLGGQIDYILDGGPCLRGIESTIIGFEEHEPVLYRLGSLPVSEIERLVGEVKKRLNQSSDPQAPGQLASHYAPSKTNLIVE
jgi:L-threonylcarbamoyladenylate synthase